MSVEGKLCLYKNFFPDLFLLGDDVIHKGYSDKKIEVLCLEFIEKLIEDEEILLYKDPMFKEIFNRIKNAKTPEEIHVLGDGAIKK